ncbi:MAG TPA: ATP-binding protein, partial [Rhodothermales bacterium]|nr:ATP-binding protein [Rhodothermales bacterium]
NDHVLSLTETTALPPGEDRVAFRYAGLSLLAPKKVRYRYMLEGADPNWIEAGTRREAFYTNLTPGTYTFRVMARNNDGIWSDEAASVTFHLRPYFYQRPIFYVLAVLGLLLLAFLTYNLRVRHLKSREKELVELVAARTHDLREEKEKTEQALRVAQEQKVIAQAARAVIEKQAEQLQEMDRIKTRFFNNISHEFRTPLTLNIGPLENALMGVYGPVDGELRRRLEIMLRNARLLLRLINQLLDISKLESGRMCLQMHEANMVALIEGIVLSFTAFAEQKNLTIDFAASEDDFTFYFDADHIEKVFFNLLSNAVKFTPKGERIAVSVAAGAPTAAGQATVEIRVRDNGPGIPQHELPHIFDRFHQVDGTISTVQEGTGIGLTLVKELVELHGGTIRVETEVNLGSIFIVTLPQITDPGKNAVLADEPMHLEDHISRGPMVEMAVVSGETPTAVAKQTPSASATVLIVDDNAEIRDYVAGCLHGTYHTLMAVDGQDALEQARTVKPDLIISDVIMPRMTGYDLCRTLKADRALAHVPLILLTSRASLDEKLKGLEAGCDDYLTKPFSARELLVRSHNLIDLSSQRKVLRALNKELRVTNEELREVSEMKSQLLRIAAHDLKNPLNGIREFAKILKEEIESGTPSIELLDLIHLSSDQMLDMVSKILDSEMLESGQLNLEMQPVSVARVAESVVRHNRPQAERKGETLLLHLDEDDPCMVTASPDWLRDALDNLVSNAIKYSPFDKTIWVTVKRHGDIVQFSVRDEGPGLTAQDKQKLFGKFQRLSATPTSDESSTGLGLSIVKQIVDLHGGRVWAESKAGAGSTFTIELAAINQRVRTTFGSPVAG